jgi:hypothetical protein
MGLSIGKDVTVVNDGRDNLNILWHKEDRQPNILYGHRIDDPKTKIVRVGVKIPTPNKPYLKIQSGKDVYEQEAHSPTLNYYIRLMSTLGGNLQTDANFALIKQDNSLNSSVAAPPYVYGSSGDLLANTANTGWASLVDLDTRSMVVGSGNTAMAVTDYKPETLILQGVTAGRLRYGAVLIVPPTNVGNVWTGYTKRVFDNFNADANTITIKEVCQLCAEWTISGGGSYQFSYLEERTVLDIPKDIPYKSGAVLTYTRSYDFSTPPDGMTDNGMYMLLMNGILCNNPGLRDYVNATTGAAWYAHYQMYDASSLIPHYGCNVGYGDTAMVRTDYKLQSLYLDGDTVNKLDYGAQSTRVSSLIGKTFLVTQARSVTNTYASSQIVKEVGITGRLVDGKYYLIARHVLGSPVTIEHDASLTVIYDFSLTYP